MALSTIEVMDKPIEGSETVSELEKALRSVGVDNARAFSTMLYTLDSEEDDEEEEIKRLSDLVHHYVTQDPFINTPLETDREWNFAIRVDYKPGVTDNAARVLKRDLGLAGVEGKTPFTSKIHYVSGKFDENLVEQLERVASNPQIHDITIIGKDAFKKQGGFEHKIHPVLLGDRPNVFDVDLGAMVKEELLKTGKLGTLNLDYVTEDMSEEDQDKIRGGTLALAEDYMDSILAYSLSNLNTKTGRKKGVLTDTELEVLAQMWSEHCRHSLYNASFPEGKDGIFKKYIRNPTERVLARRGKGVPNLGVSIYKDNGGVFEFDEDTLIVLKNETHNSPSALDPFGGAITGIVGVNRDPAGTGLGAEVIGNFLFYFLGHKNDKRKYYKTKTSEGNLENLLLNPPQIFGGVVKGVEEGANQMGIGLNLGMAQFHDNYNGKPIVGVGCFGKMKKKIGELFSHEKHIDVGDRLYIVGGRAGRDGIHGATFSSEELSANSPATAVQIGDPYTQKKMFEALLELRDLGYIKFVTDLGAGGVSCAAFEMAEETGGIDMDLDKLLIKYEGMTATELLLNESQERMAIAIDENNKDEIEKVLKKHEVEFSDIGVFTNSGRAVVECKGEEVVNLDMEFVNTGFPDRKLNPEDYKLTIHEQDRLRHVFNEELEKERNNYGSNDVFIQSEFWKMHARPNLASIADITDKMDATVKSNQVQHCIQGKGRVTTESACTRVKKESNSALVQSFGHAERQTYIDAEKMGKNSFLRSIGNTIAMGGKLDHMVATDQALWQSSDDGKYQQMLIEANKGMAEVIDKCNLPVISGKDSMYNQATIYDENGHVVKRGVYPTLLMTTMAKIDNSNELITISAKNSGDVVYVVGSSTKADFGGSEYMNMYSEKMGIELSIGRVSDEDVTEVYDTFQKMDSVNKTGMIKSSKYISAGGLMTAIRDTAMAGEKGIIFDIDELHTEGGTLEAKMYGETEGRFLVTVKEDAREEFEKAFEGKYSKIGCIWGNRIVMHKGENIVLDESVDEMLETYHGMGEVKDAA